MTTTTTSSKSKSTTTPPPATVVGNVVPPHRHPVGGGNKTSAATRRRQSLIVSGEGIGTQSFYTPQSAALFCLLSHGIPVLDFLYWALSQRTYILNNPARACLESTWQFRLLQDQSLTELVEHISSSRLTQGINGGLFPPPPSCTTITKTPGGGSTQIKEEPASSSGICCLVDSNVAVLSFPNSSRTCSTVPTSSDPCVDPPPPPPPATSATNEVPLAAATAPPAMKLKGTRGSSRRIPEKQGLVDCPECGRRGQSIFDPNSHNAEGMVWEYYYCRNSECPKGRSNTRYIGWTMRQR